MHAPNDNTGPRGLRGWWASPPRSGMRLIIWPYVYRHLRPFGRVCIAAGIVAVGLAAVTLVGGSFTAEAVGWAMFFLAVGAVNLATAAWFLAIVRSESARA
jgi:predicted MFS family arabinose efflux permease